MVSSGSCSCWLYKASPSSAAKNIMNLILVLTIWWCPCTQSFLELLEKGICMTSMFFWQNPASFCTPRPNLPVTLGTYWPPSLHSNPLWWKGYLFFFMLALEGLVDLHRTSQLQLLGHQWLGHGLGLLWCWKVCLGNELRPFYHFWDCTQVVHFKLFCWLWGLLHFFLRDSSPQ